MREGARSRLTEGPKRLLEICRVLWVGDTGFRGLGMCQGLQSLTGDEGGMCEGARWGEEEACNRYSGKVFQDPPCEFA